MCDYYKPGKPVYSWFRSLDRVTQAMGFRYDLGEVAHLDLLQEATDPTWSKLSRIAPAEFDKLRVQDLPFLQWQFKSFPVRTIICNGRTVFKEVCRLINGQVLKEGENFALLIGMCGTMQQQMGEYFNWWIWLEPSLFGSPNRIRFRG